MNSKPCNIGVNIPPKAFQKEHIVDGSLVQLHTSGGVTGFNCSDAQAQELVRILLYWTNKPRPSRWGMGEADGWGH